MIFRKFQHIVRLSEGVPIEYYNGKCYVFPKIDGTNSSVWLENNQLCAGSRNRKLTLDNDNADFLYNIKDNQNILEFLKDFPKYRLFGEWLVPHTLKNYTYNSWKKFYVFDVIDETNVSDETSSEEYRKLIRYISYEEYSKLLKNYNIEFLPCIKKLSNTNNYDIIKCLELNGYLTTDGIGEGIVIKNYDYINDLKVSVYQKHWFKVVTQEFLEKKQNKYGSSAINKNKTIEEKIIDYYLTESFIRKEYAKIINNNSNVSKEKLIPMTLNKIFFEFINEEVWNIIKKYKYPTIDFKALNCFAIKKIKEILIELF